MEKLSRFLTTVSPFVCFVAALMSAYHALWTDNFQLAWVWMVLAYVAKEK